ncbi:hypothetical protein CI610_01275 [invertebrate metagenome]|uniref:Uncharacterized protein n=1 Tax=invertebrate metagenome TaxID=1711999 RepID=A0A2H9T967_9ZZZZ
MIVSKHQIMTIESSEYTQKKEEQKNKFCGFCNIKFFNSPGEKIFIVKRSSLGTIFQHSHNMEKINSIFSCKDEYSFLHYLTQIFKQKNTAPQPHDFFIVQEVIPNLTHIRTQCMITEEKAVLTPLFKKQEDGVIDSHFAREAWILQQTTIPENWSPYLKEVGQIAFFREWLKAEALSTGYLTGYLSVFENLERIPPEKLILLSESEKDFLSFIGQHSDSKYPTVIYTTVEKIAQYIMKKLKKYQLCHNSLVIKESLIFLLNTLITTNYIQLKAIRSNLFHIH